MLDLITRLQPWEMLIVLLALWCAGALLIALITILNPNKKGDVTNQKKEKHEMGNSNKDSLFTSKETNLLVEALLTLHPSIMTAANLADLRSKVNVFLGDDEITVQKIENKQGKTRVRIFSVDFEDEDGDTVTAYLPTL